VPLGTRTYVLDINIRKTSRHFLDHHGDPLVEVKEFAAAKFLADTVGTGRVHYLSHGSSNLPAIASGRRRSHAVADKEYPIPTTGLLVQTAHACFATHQAFGLNPDTIWQTIVNQVAEHIKQNPDRYSSLFTWFPGQKAEIEVRDDKLLVDADWQRALGKFEDPLRFMLGDDVVELFVPNFSTTTQLERVASLVTLMDAASPYYEYAVLSMCHIPRVRLEGAAQDWTRLYELAVALSDRIDGLAAYFEALLPVLLEISRTAQGEPVDNDFWSSIYKFKSDSGSEMVTGWLTALMAFKYGPAGPVARNDFDWRRQIDKPRTAFETNQIPSLLSTVPFTWKNQGTDIPMTFVAGALGVSSVNNVYTPKLGFAVLES